MPESRSDAESSDTLYDKLDKLIQEYVKKNFEEQGEQARGDYIASWALLSTMVTWKWRTDSPADIW